MSLQRTEGGNRKTSMDDPSKNTGLHSEQVLSDRELRILSEINPMSASLELEEKQVFMSLFNPRLATEAMKPFQDMTFKSSSQYHL